VSVRGTGTPVVAFAGTISTVTDAGSISSTPSTTAKVIERKAAVISPGIGCRSRRNGNASTSTSPPLTVDPGMIVIGDGAL
jgi:hypothetical protein